MNNDIIWNIFITEFFNVITAIKIKRISLKSFCQRENVIWLAEIIKASLELVKKYNPNWDCFSERINVKNSTLSPDGFKKKEFLEFDSDIPFTYESWNGRMIACRGIQATLTKEKTELFSAEHIDLLKKMTDDNFSLKHQIAIFCFEKIQED